MSAAKGNVVGNFEDKYASKNPLARMLVHGFLDAVTELLVLAQPGGKTILEVGCGEGKLADHLVRNVPEPARYLATDLSLERLVPNLDPRVETGRASVHSLPFATDSFDIVVCCEVLEHVDDPGGGLAELARVARERVLISTPWEPTWRLMNMARGKYLRSLGNTPGHVQHFTRRELEQLAARWLGIHAVRRPLPWTVILGEPID
ncbi:class I SAM-dependent methyltransferase [Pseudenhygromyxa sp. WMMC2535]|uniref:class I SAM-dependent methyltransferase n=1 Tax=Pseudenhygromyxa sp. WMMC2535 TaxID=2712867 RepID=UPI001556169B|nr:class I SAM-dependent methyltransferase [Pseudenhygromyxa sp. WMMC2535]NVB36999.1 class I SAM-dependent methyltransferase [Pseudenhygromyxa sp. WMMC2535]